MAYDRIYNFSAGPSMLPEEVLLKAQSEVMNYRGSGMSVMEMSHRSKVYDEIIKDAERLMREVMNIPDNYKVLFLQGGASLQFAMIPMNLMTKNGKADYICTGSFSSKAAEEAKKYGTVNIAATTKSENFARIPQQDELKLDPEADYVHICYNNTIYGSAWNYIPDTGKVPLVADMSSCIMSEPVDVSKFALIYAGAQKNVAPAGLTIVIIREDLLGEPLPFTPVMMNYAIMAKNDSMYNTPPCYPIYICKMVLEWLRDMGGLTVMRERNIKKANLLYDYLNTSKLFKASIQENSRSMMNVTFRTGDEELDAKFVKEATAAGMSNLKGHRSAGGMRASIYNAMPYEGVEYLVNFMKKFEEANS
ncbi:MAG: 3-phosphoserine/phosphohydroxythreonine transaminase [Clostridia bacterium]|nr:3-phosphoserine/phosphohydroxythreonine transaminase [Clostridia bacterium]